MSSYLDELHYRHRRREVVPSAALFYYRSAEGGGIEQVCAVDGIVTAKPITRRQAMETAKQLMALALQGWTDD